MTPARQPALWKTAAVVWTLLLLTACWLPQDAMPPEDTIDLGLRIPNLDKLVHASMFIGFGALWMLSGLQTRGRAILTVVAGVALAALSEAGQATSFVNRDANLMDGLADLAGLGLGMYGAFRLSGRGEKMVASGPVAVENRA